MMKKLLFSVLLLLMTAIGAVAQSTEVTIGDGTGTGYYLPVNTYFNYSLTQQIYTADEIGMAGTISAVSFDYSYSSSFSMSGIKVYMMNTSKSSFASNTDMVALSGATLVYDGVFSATGSGWATITLDTPFEYEGDDNLLICVYDATSGYPGSSYKFKYTTTTEYTSITYYSDSYTPSLDNVSSFSGSKSYNQYHNNIKLDITPAPVTSCSKPTELAKSNLTARSVDLTWVAGGEETEWQICLNGNEDNLIVATTNPYTLENLTPETAYTVKVRANCGSEQSRWSNTVSFTTLPSCPVPTELAYADVTTNSVVLSWTASGSETAWQICINNNETELVDVTENPYTLTELAPATTYSVKVRANCGDTDGNSQWTSAVQFTTPCEAISSLPYEQGFESSGVPSCWTKVGSGTATGYSYASQANTGSYSLRFSGTTSNNIIAMPQFDESLSSLVLDFYTRPESNTNSSCGTFEVGYITDLTDVATFVALDTYSYDDWASANYEEKTVNMTSVPAGSYMAFNHKANSSSWYWFVDDVTVREAFHGAEILTYSLPTQVADATIDNENAAIAVTVAYTTDFNALAPVYTISENAEISAPVVTVAGDGESCTIEYDVTAEDGTTIKHWTVTVTKAPVSHDAFITAFTFASQKPETTAVIVSENDTYTVNAVAVWNANLTNIAPSVTISSAATVVPESGVAQDFTNPVTYTVTAEDGTTINAYTVTIVNDPDACINPATVNVTDITTTTATLGWAQSYTETSYLVKVATEAMTDMTATADVFDGTVEATTKALEGLNANTQYFVYVQSDCENAEGWTSTNFTTLCYAVDEFPFTEGFETITRPDCWTEETTGTHYWTFGQSGSSDYYPGTHSGNYNASYRHVNSGDKAKLVSPVFDFGEITGAVLEFWRKNPSWAGDIDYLKVYYRTAGDAEWTLLESYTDASSSWKKESITLVNLSSTYQIAFEATDNYGYGMGLDDVLVRELSNEAEIVDFTFPTRMTVPVINSEAGTITTTASYQADLENLGETVTVSDGAEYVAGATSIEGNVKTFAYTVTAEDGTTTKNWTVTVTKAESASTANDIVAFSFVGQVGESVIDPEAKTVTAYAEWDFDFENNTIAPTIEVSPMATISNDGEARNFFGSDETPVQYTVTAEDGTTTQIWNVTIVNDPNACVNPDEITSEDVTATTATLTWAQAYTETSYLVKVSTTQMTDMTVEADVYDGVVTLAENADEATLALTDLSAATIYYVYVQSNCENAESWTVTYFGTECDGSAYSVPFVETFDMSSNSVLCWTIIDANNDAVDYGYGYYNGEWNIGNFVNGGEAAYIYSSSNDAEDWLISPKIAVVDGAYLTFDYMGDGYYTEKFSVYVMDAPANYAEATQILATQIVENAEYESIANIDLSAYAGQEIYIGIKCESDADQDVLFIDNFKVMLPVYTITATAGENGTIDPESAEVMYGYDKMFTITPAEGYRIATVVVDAETEDEANVANDVVAGEEAFFYTFENVTANHTINVTFELIPTYTITVNAGENGNVYYNDALVSAPIVVNEGATPEFEITPATGYQIDVLTVGGNTIELTEQQLGGFTYTFDPVMADITLAVTFEAIPANTHTITLTVGEHGTVTATDEDDNEIAIVDGVITVNDGEDVYLEFTPEENYRIDEIIVNGVSLELEEEDLEGFIYPMLDVTGDYTVSVTFTRLNAADMLEAGSMSIYPNPNNGMFSIDFSNIEGDATYQIIDARGAVVETRDINVMNGETMNFNHSLNAGTYFVRIINGDKVYVEQIVVE